MLKNKLNILIKKIAYEKTFINFNFIYDTY